MLSLIVKRNGPHCFPEVFYLGKGLHMFEVASSMIAQSCQNVLTIFGMCLKTRNVTIIFWYTLLKDIPALPTSQVYRKIQNACQKSEH